LVLRAEGAQTEFSLQVTSVQIEIARVCAQQSSKEQRAILEDTLRRPCVLCVSSASTALKSFFENNDTPHPVPV
jgi:hypothetical protein